jgi:hypothetical protein
MPEPAERSAPIEKSASTIAVPDAAPVDAMSPARPILGLRDTAGGRAVRQLDASRLLGLQRTVGNRGVSQLVARRPEDVDPPAASTTKELIDKAYQSKDPGDVKAIGNKNFGEATEPQRWDFIHTLAFQGWVGPRDEWALEALWGLWGDWVLTRAAEHPDYWAKSIEGGAELLDLPSVKATPPKFIEDVRAVATGYLDKNEEYAKREQADLGEHVEGVMGPPRDPNARMAEIEEGAKLIRSAQKAQAALGDYAVGWFEAHDEDSSPDMPEEEQKKAPPAGFVHGSPPFYAYKAPRLTYAEVDAQWQVLQKVIEGQQAKYPALYAVAHHGESDDMQKIADSGAGGRDLILHSLRDLRTHITETRPKLEGNLAYEIAPIHGQLFSGATKGPSQIDWHDPVHKPLGEEILEGHREHEFWLTLGLGSLAAGMFLIATLGAGAPLVAAAAAGAGAGVSAGVAAASWEKAYTLAQAEKTSASKETELVASGAANAAVVEAVINSVFAVMDGWAAFKLAGKAAELAGGALVTTAANAGAASRIVVGLERLGTMAQREAAELATRAITELGVEETLKRSGQTVKDLLAIVGERSLAGARVRAFMALPDQLTKLTAEELHGRLAALASEADRETANQLAQLGVERLGPLDTVRAAGGWEALAKSLDKQGQAMRALEGWRDAALTDLDTFLDKIAVGAKDSGADSKLAKEYLASRLGGTAEELGVGTAKPLIPGTGEKDVVAALAAAADRRALSGKGLGGEAAMKAMATEGEALREGWAALTPRQRLDKLFELANRRLKEIGVPEMKLADFGKDDGAFLHKSWKFELNEGLLAKGDNLDWLLEASYHEARHAEQAFQVARLKAGEGWTVERMVKSVEEQGLGIHPEVASDALGKPIEAESAEGRQAASWFESMMGAGSKARGAVMTRMDEAFLHWETAKEMIKIGNRPGYWIAKERELWERYLLAVEEYRKLPEEADAYAIQARFREALKEHERLLRQAETDAMPPTVREPAAQK